MNVVLTPFPAKILLVDILLCFRTVQRYDFFLKRDQFFYVLRKSFRIVLWFQHYFVTLHHQYGMIWQRMQYGKTITG